MPWVTEVLFFIFCNILFGIPTPSSQISIYIHSSFAFRFSLIVPLASGNESIALLIKLDIERLKSFGEIFINKNAFRLLSLYSNLIEQFAYLRFLSSIISANTIDTNTIMVD